MLETCHECGGSTIAERGPQEVQVGERFVTVEAEYSRCTSCGEIVFDLNQADAMQRAAAEQVRREEALLLPEEIQAIRARYGFSEDDLEQLIRARPPRAVTRWERGTMVQSGPADTLLRIFRDRPDVVEQLVRERQR